jgi:hypothetical protein
MFLTLVLLAHSRRTGFALALAPTAGTSTFIAPYNFNYDPNALPYVVIASGTVDNAKWGLISPATVSSEPGLYLRAPAVSAERLVGLGQQRRPHVRLYARGHSKLVSAVQ